MCGIFGYVGERRDAAVVVLEGLRALEYRGYDSWGVAVPHGDRVLVEKRVGKIGGATTSLPAGSASLGHTRWATHGGVTETNAHPHADCHGRFAVVHNGMVENDLELRRALRDAGHRFESETDTEVVAHLLEETLAGTGEHGAFALVTATMAVFRRLRGVNAIAVLDVATGAIAAAKNGSPLVVGFSPSGHLIASDATALLPHTRRVAFVGEGHAVLLEARRARLFDVESGSELELSPAETTWSVESADRGAHPDYMTKEMHEQPAVLARLAGDTSSASTIATELARAADVLAVGCGSGFNAALAAEYLFANAGKRVTAVRASEFAYHAAFVRPGSLVLALSQSGETIDVLEVARTARARGGRVLALTNVAGSSLARIADTVVSLDAGPERAVVATKSFVAELALLFMARGALAGGADGARALLDAARTEVASLLDGDRRRSLRELAEVLCREAHAYVLGRGLGHALALEAALKIKEVSYIHAEGFAAGELKHGAIALVEKGTPCLVIAPDDDTSSDVTAAAMQVRARGAFVVGFSPKRHPSFDRHVRVANLGDATAIPISVAGQLLGYDLARLRGHDPDMPRNLAKSVTVK